MNVGTKPRAIQVLSILHCICASARCNLLDIQWTNFFLIRYLSDHGPQINKS